MSAKPVKPPKLFRKPIPEKKFNKKILKRIHIKQEKDFLLSLMEQNSSGAYVLKGELDKKNAKRLGALAKSIKKNKGIVTGWKAAILLLIAGAVLVFNLLFKDRLVEKAIETGLESVFQAPADLEDTRLKIFSGSLSFASLAVADKDRLDTNLFELAATELKINIWELLKKRVVIERIMARGIALGTPRSGDSGVEQDSEESKDTRETGGGSLIADADPQAIFDAQMSRLESPAYIDSVNEAYGRAVEKWPGKVDQLNSDLAAGRKGAEKIAAINIPSINRADEAAAALKVISDNSPAVETAVESAGAVSADFNRDRRELQELQAGIREAVSRDYALLAEAVGNPGGTLKGIASQAAENILRAKIGDYYDKAQKLLGAAGRLKKSDKEGPVKKSVLTRKGEVVNFPVQGYPRFLIQEFRVSYGSEGVEPYMILLAEDINSEPDTWGKPVEFTWDSLQEGIGVKAEGLADMRSAAETLFSVSVDLSGAAFNGGSALSGLGVENLAGDAGGSMDFHVEKDGTGHGEGRVVLGAFETEFSGSEDPLSEAVREILEETDTAVFKISFDAEGNEITSFRVSSDMDALLAEKAGEYLKDRADELKQDLQNALEAELSSRLKENKRLNQLFDEYGGDVGAGLKASGDLESSVDSKKQDLEKRTAEVSGDLKQQADKILGGTGDKIKLPF